MTQFYTNLLFLFGGPCHLNRLKWCSGDIIFLWEQLVYSVMEKNKYFQVCFFNYYLMHDVNIKIDQFEFPLQNYKLQNYWL